MHQTLNLSIRRRPEQKHHDLCASDGKNGTRHRENRVDDDESDAETEGINEADEDDQGGDGHSDATDGRCEEHQERRRNEKSSPENDENATMESEDVHDVVNDTADEEKGKHEEDE